MLVIESTAGCNATPRIVFALEELGESYELVRREDGYFLANDGVPGPALVGDGERHLEPNAILRHVARGTQLIPAEAATHIDRWIDFATLRIGMSLIRGDAEGLARYLGVLDAHLEGREWICGERFTAADCMYATVAMMAPRLPLSSHANVRGYLERLVARSAWQRARARLGS
jgi:glutathione S-transferase